MKLAGWSVNSLNVRLPRLLAWLAANAPEIVCLQEARLEEPHVIAIVHPQEPSTFFNVPQWELLLAGFC